MKGTPTVLWVAATRTSKLGPMPATYSSRATCPTSCPLLSRCYAEGIRTRAPWDKATAGTGPNTSDWKGFLAKVRALPPRTLWRHNIAGDLPGTGDRIDTRALQALARANRGRRGYTYTHKPVHLGRFAVRNRDAIRAANDAGFTINLSADTLSEADTLAETGAGPVVVVLPSDSPDKLATPAGRTVQVCPVQTGRLPDCAHCGACQSSTRRAIIGFRAHGVHKAHAENVARSK